MLKKILRKFGYVHESEIKVFRDLKKSPFTEEELCMLLVDKMGLSDDVVDEQSEKIIFTELKKLEGLTDYLKDTANKDMMRYFGAASKEEQLIIRGAYARTNYFRAKIISGGESKNLQLESARYG